MYDIFLQIVDLVHTLGYLGIFIMTVIEGTFVPIPNEVTLIPAGFLIAKGSMSGIMVFLVSVFGNIMGALLSYYLALVYGRNFLMQYGKYFFFNIKKLDAIEKFFKKHGPFSVFIGRIMPGIKHFISFPAGLAKMKVRTFCLYTGAGGTIWVSLLILLGYFIGQNDALIKQYTRYVKYSAIGICIILILFYVFKNRFNNEKSSKIKP